MQASDFVSLALSSFKSAGKILLQSRQCTIVRESRTQPLVIMANGPSLRRAIDSHAAELRQATTMAVNFAANAPDFSTISPDYYILADPHFFSAGTDSNLITLRHNLATVDWPLTLLVPAREAGKLPAEILNNSHTSLQTYNLVGIEGFASFEHAAYSRGLGMPRPRNVLVAAIACGILAGYKEIYILGADHTWIRNLDVDDCNRVISVQPHFYKESEKEQKRIDTVYRDVRLHQVIESFAVALKSYHDLRSWADAAGVHIYNATPGSLIDAFDRRSWPAPAET